MPKLKQASPRALIVNLTTDLLFQLWFFRVLEGIEDTMPPCRWWHQIRKCLSVLLTLRHNLLCCFISSTCLFFITLTTMYFLCVHIAEGKFENLNVIHSSGEPVGVDVLQHHHRQEASHQGLFWDHFTGNRNRKSECRLSEKSF